MAGTWASYQGFPCVDVRFIRGRGPGVRPDPGVTVIVIPAKGNLEVYKPSDASLKVPADVEKPSFAAITDATRPVPHELGDALKPEGTLVMAEADANGVKAVTIAGMFVLRVETVRRSTTGEVAWWRVYLVDERFFLTLGLMPRFSYNRRRGDGKSLAADSLDENGKEFSLERIFRSEIAAKTFRGVPDRVSHIPADWSTDTREWSFPRYQPASQAMVTVIRTMGVEDACLRLDRTLAIHEPGDGLTGGDGRTIPGYAATDANGVPSGPNKTELPENYRVWLNGTGQGRSLEFGYPERYLLVSGGARVATVAIDSWEPVLVIHGKPVPLTEETIRTLTVGRHGLDWLHRWLVQPPAHQHAIGVTQSVLDLLRTQAYRLFRLPGAVTYDADGDPKPGYNAHLLPLLRRAEMDGKGRLDITVQTYRYQTKHRTFEDEDSSAEAKAFGAAARTQAELTTIIKEKAAAKKVTDPWSLKDEPLAGKGLGELLSEFYGNKAKFADSVREDDLAGSLFGFGINISSTDWEKVRREAITVDRIKSIDPGLASRYEAAVKAKYAAGDTRDGTANAELYEIAKDFVRSDPNRPRSAIKAASEAVLRLDEKVGQQLAEKKTLEAAGGRLGTPGGAVYYKNLERELPAAGVNPTDSALRLGGLFVRDPVIGDRVEAVAGDDLGASVYSDDLGIVRTSSLAGWLLDPNVHDSGSTQFVPKPVRVLFGAVVRPRTDRPMGTPGAGSTGSAAGAVRDQKPEALSDMETYFTAVYERTSRGVAVPIDLAKLDDAARAEVLRSAALLERPDLAELLPLAGAGNLNDLLAQSLQAAQAIFRRPDILRSETITMLRPWPVNCDGIVREVEIQMRHHPVTGAPCGFLTIVRTGSSAWKTPGTGTSSRPPRPRGADDDRERLKP